jgi:hypothetical protein
LFFCIIILEDKIKEQVQPKSNILECGIMSERKISVEEILQRIDQLLDVLKEISKDLVDLSKSLKTAVSVTPTPAAATPTAPTPAAQMRPIAEVRALFPKDLDDMLIFEVSGKYIIIKPRQYLGSENFAKIASIIRGTGGEYISAGKESHFRIPRELRYG